MPIKSYLVFPHAGRSPELLQSLSSFDNCNVIPSDNNEVFVLVTDTASDKEDEQLLNDIQSNEYLHHVSFISGFTTEQL
jgi:nitrate reductase NapAB chaperone NapD